MSNNNNRINVPEARQAMYNMKHEIAGELGINLKQGYNGDLTSKQAGHIGGNMVKRMIEAQERSMSGMGGTTGTTGTTGMGGTTR